IRNRTSTPKCRLDRPSREARQGSRSGRERSAESAHAPGCDQVDFPSRDGLHETRHGGALVTAPGTGHALVCEGRHDLPSMALGDRLKLTLLVGDVLTVAGRHADVQTDLPGGAGHGQALATRWAVTLTRCTAMLTGRRPFGCR